MDFFAEYFVRTVGILLLAAALCNANAEFARFNFTEKKSVATSFTTLHNISDIQCVRKCNKERQNGKCTLAEYNKATQSCGLSDDDAHTVIDTEDEMTGVFFFELNMTGKIHIPF